MKNPWPSQCWNAQQKNAAGVAGFEISVARYSPATKQWLGARKLTFNSNLDRSPRLAGVTSNNVILTWISNSANDARGSAAAPVSAMPSRVTAERREAWREPVTGMEFVWVRGGCFWMGSPDYEKDREHDEGPMHRVCVDDFWMGKYPVTRGQFRRFVDETGFRTDADKEGWAYNLKEGRWDKQQGGNWRFPGFDQSDSHPVVDVSWNDAKAVAEWLSRHGNGKFRLPSEAEWEYGCRAGTVTARFWGNHPDKACAYANVADQSAQRRFPGWAVHNCKDGYVFTSPVGSFRPNPFGLYDILGNVCEWCEDTYASDAYSKSRRDNPVYTGGGQHRVIRGGSWYNRPAYVRCAYRGLGCPAVRGNLLGFRLVWIPYIVGRSSVPSSI